MKLLVRLKYSNLEPLSSRAKYVLVIVDILLHWVHTPLDLSNRPQLKFLDEKQNKYLTTTGGIYACKNENKEIQFLNDRLDRPNTNLRIKEENASVNPCLTHWQINIMARYSVRVEVLS